MGSQFIKLTAIGLSLVGLTSLGLLPTTAVAEGSAQQLRELQAGHQALAMKVRPLHDRVLAGSQSEGSARRVPERLRHKDRAVSSVDEQGRIKVRFSAFEKKASKERERIMRPKFGSNPRMNKGELIDAIAKLEALEREFAALKREVNTLAR